MSRCNDHVSKKLSTSILHYSQAADIRMEEDMTSFEVQLGYILMLWQLKVNVTTQQLAGNYAVNA